MSAAQACCSNYPNPALPLSKPMTVMVIGFCIDSVGTCHYYPCTHIVWTIKMTTSVMLNLRATTEQRDLIDRAAEIRNQNRTEFMLDVACREARDTILDQCHFRVDDDAMAAFEQALESNPMATNTALQSLLARPTPWATASV